MYYCKKCGKPTDINYTGLCGRCIYLEGTKGKSLAEVLGNLNKARKKQKRREYLIKGIILIVIIALSIKYPLIGLLYIGYKVFMYKLKDSLTPSSKKRSRSYYSYGSSSSCGGGGGSSSSTFTEDTVTKEVTIIGGDGNIYTSSSPIFCDWEKNIISKGSPFKDSRGNWCQWGSSFYDNRGELIQWGDPFYDADDRLVDPRG